MRDEGKGNNRFNRQPLTFSLFALSFTFDRHQLSETMARVLKQVRLLKLPGTLLHPQFKKLFLGGNDFCFKGVITEVSDFNNFGQRHFKIPPFLGEQLLREQLLREQRAR